MAKVLVNYRPGDEDAFAVLLEQRLSSRFGPDHIARADGTSAAMRSSAVLLVVIGMYWLAHMDEHGHNALDTHDDPIRREILAAFDADIPVVPVMVGRAERLRSVDLPRRLARLADCQYVRIDPGNAEPGLRDLGDKLLDLVPGLTDEPESVAHQGIGDGADRR